MSSTGYTGKKMKNDIDKTTQHTYFTDVKYAGDRDRPFKSKKFFTEDLSRRVVKIESRIVGENESVDLEGQWVKISIPSKIIDNFTRLKVLLD